MSQVFKEMWREATWVSEAEGTGGTKALKALRKECDWHIQETARKRVPLEQGMRGRVAKGKAAPARASALF